MVAPPDHLRGHVLDGAAEGVGPVLGLMWEKLPAKTSTLITCHRYINSRLRLSVLLEFFAFLYSSIS